MTPEQLKAQRTSLARQFGYLNNNETAGGGLIASRRAGDAREQEYLKEVAKLEAQAASSPSPAPTAAPAAQPTALSSLMSPEVGRYGENYWNSDTATAVGQLFGYLAPGESTGGGKLNERWMADTSPKRDEFLRIRSELMTGKSSPDQLLQYFTDREIQNEIDEPTYGSLSESAFKDFTPFTEEAPRYSPFTLQDFEESPSYQFRLESGQNALDRAAAARGGFYSGQALKNAAEYASDLASQEFDASRGRHVQDYTIKAGEFTDRYNRYNNDYNIGYQKAQNDSDTLFNRLFATTGLATGSSNTLANANQNNSNALGNILGQSANAQAASTLSQGNIASNSISDILGRSFGTSSYTPVGPKVTTQGQLPWLS